MRHINGVTGKEPFFDYFKNLVRAIGFKGQHGGSVSLDGAVYGSCQIGRCGDSYDIGTTWFSRVTHFDR